MSERKPKVIRILEALGVDPKPAKIYNDLNESEKSHMKQRYKLLLRRKNK